MEEYSFEKVEDLAISFLLLLMHFYTLNNFDLNFLTKINLTVFINPSQIMFTYFVHYKDANINFMFALHALFILNRLLKEIS